jgi:phosphoesterase family protein
VLRPRKDSLKPAVAEVSPALSRREPRSMLSLNTLVLPSCCGSSSGRTGNVPVAGAAVADGTGGGPMINNAEVGYDWSTYPERLERAGVSWKGYQDLGDGLTAAGSWGWTQDPCIRACGVTSPVW